MITSALLNIIYAFVVAMIALLPSATILPDGLETAMEFFRTFIAGIIDLIPALSVLPTIIGLIITLEIAMFAWKSINWIINIVRGSGN